MRDEGAESLERGGGCWAEGLGALRRREVQESDDSGCQRGRGLLDETGVSFSDLEMGYESSAGESRQPWTGERQSDVACSNMTSNARWSHR